MHIVHFREALPGFVLVQIVPTNYKKNKKKNVSRNWVILETQLWTMLGFNITAVSLEDIRGFVGTRGVKYMYKQIFITILQWITMSLTESVAPHWRLRGLSSAQLWFTVCYFLVRSALKGRKSRKNQNLITLKLKVRVWTNIRLNWRQGWTSWWYFTVMCTVLYMLKCIWTGVCLS